MQQSDVKVLEDVPFLAWAKGEDGRYLWGNRAIAALAGQDVAGKTDRELWGSDYDLAGADQRALETGEPQFVHEHVDPPAGGPRITLNVCKFLAEFDGRRCVFGVSFTIP